MNMFEQAFEALECGADPSKGYGPRKNTALHLAASMHGDRIVGLLLSRGAHPDPRNNSGDTPLISAVRQGVVSTTQQLVDAKADVNAQNSNGETALAQALAAGNEQFINFLRANGATA